MSGICVIGLGSPHGDDQAGWELIRLLEREVTAGKVDTRLRLCTCAAPDGALLELWRSAELAIIVDAIRGDAPPGTVRRFELHPCADLSPPRVARAVSSHGLDLPGLVELSATLGTLPQRLVLFGIEAGSCAPFESVSSPVRAALPGLAQSVCDEVDSCLSGGSRALQG